MDILNDNGFGFGLAGELFAGSDGLGGTAEIQISSHEMSIYYEGIEGVKVWTGSAWEWKPVKVWTGSEWLEKPVKFWNGSSWQVTNS